VSASTQEVGIMELDWDSDEELFFEESGLAERGDCVLVIIDIQEKLLNVMNEKERSWCASRTSSGCRCW
jgi:hypothetical protein